MDAVAKITSTINVEVEVVATNNKITTSTNYLVKEVNLIINQQVRLQVLQITKPYYADIFNKVSK